MNNAPLSNTTHLKTKAEGEVWYVDAGGGNRWQIELDADGGTGGKPLVRIRKVDKDGVLIADQGEIELDVGLLVSAPTGFRKAAFREFVFKNADDSCNPWHTWILMTEPRPV